MKIIISKKDLRVDRFRSSGPGGQNVNKTSSAIRITHESTGIVAQCQETPCQHKNYRRALELLVERLQTYYEELYKPESSPKQKIEFGSQRRTYNLVESRIVDHLTKSYTSNVKDFLNGGESLDIFIEESLKKGINNE